MQIQTQHGARSATEENTPGNPKKPKKNKNNQNTKTNPEREMTGGGLPELLSARFFWFLVFWFFRFLGFPRRKPQTTVMRGK